MKVHRNVELVFCTSTWSLWKNCRSNVFKAIESPGSTLYVVLCTLWKFAWNKYLFSSSPFFPLQFLRLISHRLYCRYMKLNCQINWVTKLFDEFRKESISRKLRSLCKSRKIWVSCQSERGLFFIFHSSFISLRKHVHFLLANAYKRHQVALLLYLFRIFTHALSFRAKFTVPWSPGWGMIGLIAIYQRIYRMSRSVKWKK